MIEIQGNKIKHNGKDIELQFNVLEAIESDGNILVIFDYMQFPANEPANNLICIDTSGKKLWVAESPTTQNTNAYTNFMGTVKTEKGSVAVNNFTGYSCIICLSTGKLLNASFTK
ncbi:hypothetical protein A3715_07265 [Oleiphilus sp. HI0009]|nr:hypothetical protein A3715_07265 [Oleiphilus sp. HI0009]